MPPTGSFFSRTLGAGCSSWRKPFTTNAVSSRSIRSLMRSPTSAGEKGRRIAPQVGRLPPPPSFLPHSAAFLPLRRLFLCSAATDGNLAFWDLTTVLDHGSTALEAPAEPGLPLRKWLVGRHFCPFPPATWP